EMQRVRDVLHVLLAVVSESERHLVANLLVGRAGDANAAGFCNAFQPCRHVHTIPEDVSTIGNDVTNIDADAELDLLLLWNSGVALSHPTLDLDSASHRVNDAAELGQQPVARVFDNPPAMFGDLRIE